MTEVSSNKLNELFVVGLTREKFIDKYKEMYLSKDETQGSSLFTSELNDNQIGAIYDSIKVEKTGNDDDILTETDIKNLASLDGESASITDDDLNILYKKMQESLQNSLLSTNETNSDNPVMTPAEGLDLLKALKFIKMQEAEHKKAKLNDEINELIQNDKNISSELKAKYAKTKQEIAKAEQELSTKQKDYQNNCEDILSIKEQISRKKGEIEGTQDEDKKNSLQNEIHDLASSSTKYDTDSQSISKDIKDLKTMIATSNTGIKLIIEQIDISSSKTAQQVKAKEAQIEQIDIDLQNELDTIDSQIELVELRQLESLEASGKQSAVYGDIANGTIPDDGHIGKNAAQALSNAASQIGVRELTGHNDGKDVAKYRNGISNGAPWCASFVSWCYKGNDVFGHQPSVSGIMMAADQKGLYAKKGSYIPKAGDIMIQKNGASHTGIVESVDSDGTIHTIEGNASNQVKRCTYKPGSRGYNTISGYVKMSANNNA